VHQQVGTALTYTDTRPKPSKALQRIIGYFAVRKDDPKFANRLMILGIVMFILVIFAVGIMTALIAIIMSAVSRGLSG
jgi:hypothetical protein